MKSTVVKLLKQHKMHISFAESCTGGLCAATLVNVPGASDVFECSFVTYAERAKEELLGVKSISECGVVSEKVASEMAEGCRIRSGADIGVGITGFAGPSGGTEEAPVGTVCFGISTMQNTFAFTEHFGNIGRAEVREAAVDRVFAALKELLEELT